MIATTLGALATAEAALQRLAGERLPYQTAYAIAKLTKAVADETKHFVDQRNVLVREYGEPRDGGTGPDDIAVTPGSPGWADFVAAVEDLAAVRASVAADAVKLGGVAGLTVSAVDLLTLAAAGLIALDDVPLTTVVPAAVPELAGR